MVVCRRCCTFIVMQSFRTLLLAVNAVVFIYGDQCEALPVSNLARFEFLKDVMAADDLWMPVLRQKIKRNPDGEKVIIEPENYDLLEDLEVSTEIEPFLVLNNLIVSGGHKGTAVDYTVYVMRTALTCMTLKYVSLLMHLTTYLIELGEYLVNYVEERVKFLTKLLSEQMDVLVALDKRLLVVTKVYEAIRHLADPAKSEQVNDSASYLANTQNALDTQREKTHTILCETCTENPVYRHYDNLGVDVDFRIFDDNEKEQVAFNDIIFMAKSTEEQMSKAFTTLPLTKMKLVLWENNTEPYEDIEDSTVLGN